LSTALTLLLLPGILAVALKGWEPAPAKGAQGEGPLAVPEPAE
jgi:hypothetical protein